MNRYTVRPLGTLWVAIVNGIAWQTFATRAAAIAWCVRRGK